MRRGFDVGAALVGVLAAISFGAELVGAVPLGLLADAVPTRMLMTGGVLLAALATGKAPALKAWRHLYLLYARCNG